MEDLRSSVLPDEEVCKESSLSNVIEAKRRSLDCSKFATKSSTKSNKPQIASPHPRVVKKSKQVSKRNKSSLPACLGAYNKRYWTDCFSHYAFATGDEYVGEWKDGTISGQGTFIFVGGHKYVGKFKGEKENGNIIYLILPFLAVSSAVNGDDKTRDLATKRIGEFYFKGSMLRHKHQKVATSEAIHYVTEVQKRVYAALNRKDPKKGTHYLNKLEEGNRKHAAGDTQPIHLRMNYTAVDKLMAKAKKSPTVIAKKAPEPLSQAQRENERLRRENARLKKRNQSKPKQVAKRPSPKPSPPPKSGSTGSGFFVSKLGHVVTNAHVVKNCRSITVGDNAKKQVTVTLLETDKRNDLALLKISSTQMASAETKSLIRKLGLKLVPTASEGLLRSDDVELGEDVLVSGFPYGEIYSNTIKVTKGIVSANRGIGDDTGQFQMDAAVQPGNSGGPIYDTNGNIIGVVVAQLNKLKFAKAIGSLPENVNFGIKASTVRQFLTASGLPTKWSNRSQSMSTKELAKIAKNQTVMVVCRR